MDGLQESMSIKGAASGKALDRKPKEGELLDERIAELEVCNTDLVQRLLARCDLEITAREAAESNAKERYGKLCAVAESNARRSEKLCAEARAAFRHSQSMVKSMEEDKERALAAAEARMQQVQRRLEHARKERDLAREQSVELAKALNGHFAGAMPLLSAAEDKASAVQAAGGTGEAQQSAAANTGAAAQPKTATAGSLQHEKAQLKHVQQQDQQQRQKQQQHRAHVGSSPLRRTTAPVVQEKPLSRSASSYSPPATTGAAPQKHARQQQDNQEVLSQVFEKVALGGAAGSVDSDGDGDDALSDPPSLRAGAVTASTLSPLHTPPSSSTIGGQEISDGARRGSQPLFKITEIGDDAGVDAEFAPHDTGSPSAAMRSMTAPPPGFAAPLSELEEVHTSGDGSGTVEGLHPPPISLPSAPAPRLLTSLLEKLEHAEKLLMLKVDPGSEMKGIMDEGKFLELHKTKEGVVELLATLGATCLAF